MDPVILSVANTLASQAAEAAVQGGKAACAALVRLVRERSHHDKQATAALETARDRPGDKAAVADLAQVLERLVSADADFGAHLRELWPRVAAELSVSEGGVVNSSTGSVGGHLMQARDVQVEGGLHFGGVPPSREQ